MRKLFAVITSALLFSLLCTSTYAHKIRVFAYEEGGSIIGEVSFNGGRKAKETTITVTDRASARQLLITQTNDEGQFTFPVPEAAREHQLDLLITANAGEGHSNKWLLEAADYLPEALDKPSPAVSQNSTPVPTESDSTQHIATISENQLRRIIDESIASQLGPVKRILAENSEKRISFQDIMGGLGYIIGLAGIAAYMKSRQGDTHDS